MAAVEDLFLLAYFVQAICGETVTKETQYKHDVF